MFAKARAESRPPPAALTCGGRGRRRRRLLSTALANAREAVLLAQHGLPLGQRAVVVEADVAVRDLRPRGDVARRDDAQFCLVRVRA